ncbi:cordon-bleu protein-like 1b isoform X2 [Electrophorus electricus]|uniref:cordon-bleu protein-like 1b isoform X2 n=1 Tax=Electrophorus electricus TaxID=8005 RepID=UPI0015D069BD|nr:cordon-bleu protein-like 1b isoform X2 [Electrophorus electricus]
MRVDNRADDQRRSGRSYKSKAPPPPPAPHGPASSTSIPKPPRTAMEPKESLLEQELLLTVVLPEGVEKTTQVHGSKPMMDLLVMLCAKYHLNPSSHTMELVSANRNHIKFKPNALIGALEAEKVVLKPKGMEDKNRKTGPQMPEATVRLVINYKKTQKTILRVNPRVALRELLPAICEKCEFETQSTVLVRNVRAEEPLDLDNSLNDLGLREVYARDMRVISPAGLPSSPTRSDIIQLGKDKLQKEKENKGLFSLFKRGSKKKPDQALTVSAPASPIQRKSRPSSMSSLSVHSPTYDSNSMLKKKRAPQPPRTTLQCGSTDHRHRYSSTQLAAQPDGTQVQAHLCRAASADSSLKRSKRKAPPPPTSPISPTITPTITHSCPAAAAEEVLHDKAGTGLQQTLEEIQEKEEAPVATETPEVPMSSSPAPESPSPNQELLEDNSSINLSADVSLGSGRVGTTSPSEDLDMGTVAVPVGSSEDLTTDGKLAADSQVNGDEPKAHTPWQPADDAGIEELLETASATAEKSTDLRAARCGQAEVPRDIAAPDPASLHALTHPQAAEPQAPPRSSPAGAASGAEPTASDEGRTHTEIQTEEWGEPAEIFPSPPPELLPVGSKRDMATSTEELFNATARPALAEPVSAHSPQSPPSGHPQAPTGQPLVHAHAPESCPPVHAQAPTSHPSMGPPAPESQSSSLLPSATKAGHLHYITDSEPRPKPSNELTREYIPKVGMTTYTIVPQRSLDKLRVFEVELTLESALAPEARHAAAEGEASKTPASSPPQPSNGRASPGPLGELSRSAPRSPMSPMESDNSGSKIKEKKVPPATRPKPASFRVPQHKRTPGSYVNSAAVRSLSVSDGCSGGAAGGGHIESPDGPQRGSYAGETHECFPPPPPAVQWGEEEKEPEGPQQAALPPPPPPQLEQEESETPTPLLSPKEAAAPGQRVRSQLPRQLSLPLREQPPAGLSLDKLRSFTAPKPYLPVMSSRFAQAVSSAVRRSHSLPYSSVGQAAHKVPLVLHRHGPIRGSSGLPESPTGPDVNSGSRQMESDGKAWPPMARYGDLEPSVPPNTPSGTQKNGTAELAPECVASPVTCPTQESLPEATKCQDE